jgi:hypothetical protein
MSGRETPGHVYSDEHGNLWDGITGKPIEAPWQREPAKVKPLEEPAESEGDAGSTEPARAPGAVNIEARLAEIRALRRTDEKRYWSNDIQAEELALLRARTSTKAEPSGRAAEESGTEGEEGEPAGDDSDAELTAVERELGELRVARKASRTGSLSPEQERRELALIDRCEVLRAGAGQMSPELVERWREGAGLKANMERAVDIAGRAGEAAFEEIAQAVDALPDGLAVEVTDQLRLDWPEVSGSEAHRADIAASRLDGILSNIERRHGVRAGAQIEAAIAKLSPAARAGIVRMLAGG